jgi:hypothetical protein
VAEGARLESVFRGNSNVGSNPTLSARFVPRGEEVLVAGMGERLTLQRNLQARANIPETRAAGR